MKNKTLLSAIVAIGALAPSTAESLNLNPTLDSRFNIEPPQGEVITETQADFDKSNHGLETLSMYQDGTLVLTNIFGKRKLVGKIPGRFEFKKQAFLIPSEMGAVRECPGVKVITPHELRKVRAFGNPYCDGSLVQGSLTRDWRGEEYWIGFKNKF